ncbi:MAG: hypothetical protein DPW15_16245 [Chloroflexi bacterium]|nr:hypothetical protein [Chloroflexota bacterium]
MKILMFGAGVINTLYGYALAEAGNDVTHYVRPGKKKMLEGGINLKFLDGRASPPKQATAQYGGVRHYQLDSVLPVLKDKIGNADILIFNGNWDGFGNLDQFFPRSQYLLGFPVAGGGYSGTTLDGALLDEIRLGELDGKSTPRLEHVANVFRDADIKVDVQSDMQRWLWVHFAINSGIIGAAFKAGSAQKLLNSIPLLRTGILAGREALEVCRARGVNVDSFEDAKSFYLPVWIAAAGVWYMMKSNLPARKIMETHTAVDELQAIYRDVLKSGEALGVPMPHFKSLKPYVDNPPVLHGA